jgi:hypothetical protein
MTVNQKWIGNILADNAGFVYVYIVNIVNNLNTAALAGVSWF